MNLADICKELQNCFIKVRHFTFVDDQELLKDALDRIRDYEKYIIDKQIGSECPILVYCIKTLFEIAAENNKKKMYDFADAIHNMPEIYLGKRTYDSFLLEITSFCDIYGDSYFKCL